MLSRLGVSYKTVRSDADLDGISLLVLGRNALKDFPLHLSKRLSEGLKLFVFEQPFEEIERLGLRGTEQGYREVFSAAEGFPDLRDWRGGATQLPGALAVAAYEATNPKWNWCGFDNTRVWRAGNRAGAVADALFGALERGGIAKEGRCGYPSGLSYPPDWGERTISFRRDDDTILEAGMTFHFMPGLWMEDWGLEITESILIRDSGPAECLCDRPRKLFVKD